MTVYLIQDSGSQLVKIGHTSDMRRRMTQMQTNCPTQLSLVRELCGGKDLEIWLHQRFARLHVRGEWFSFDEEMLAVSPPDALTSEPAAEVEEISLPDVPYSFRFYETARKTFGGQPEGAASLAKKAGVCRRTAELWLRGQGAPQGANFINLVMGCREFATLLDELLVCAGGVPAGTRSFSSIHEERRK